MENFDCIVLGGGPGGYTAAIRAAQLKKKVAIVESVRLGGVCLNRGCIPTKALIKAAHAVHEVKSYKALGVDVEVKNLDAGKAVLRAQSITQRVAKGVDFLMKKNKIKVFEGTGKLKSKNEVEVCAVDGSVNALHANNIIIATGAHYKSFPGLRHDGKRLIGAYEAIKLEEMPASIGVIGAGAIGVELAYFWNAFGVDVHIFELEAHLLPIEDSDSSLEVEKAYKRYGIECSLGLDRVSAKSGSENVKVKVVNKDGSNEYHEFEKVLIAVGMTGNIENMGLKEVGIDTANGFISVDENMQTGQAGVYAIGDVVGPPLLAHVASHQGVIAAEHLSGLSPHHLQLDNIPGCTYCYPQVASVGKTESELKSSGVEYRVGKLPFAANGKALASNEKSGHVKVLLGEYGELLGAHIVGENAVELIHELTLFKQMEGVGEDLTNTVHPHPTLGEWLSEAVLAAQGVSLNY